MAHNVASPATARIQMCTCPHRLTTAVQEAVPSKRSRYTQLVARNVVACAESSPGGEALENTSDQNSSDLPSVHSGLKQRLQEEALTPEAYRKFRHKSSWWFKQGAGSPEEVYEVFLDTYGDSQYSELLFFSFAGVLCSLPPDLYTNVRLFCLWLQFGAPCLMCCTRCQAIACDQCVASLAPHCLQKRGPKRLSPWMPP